MKVVLLFCVLSLLVALSLSAPSLSASRAKKLLELQTERALTRGKVLLKDGTVITSQNVHRGHAYHHRKYYREEDEDQTESDTYNDFSFNIHPYIVKFDSDLDLTSEVARQIEKLSGVTLRDYVPHNSYIVVASNREIDLLKALPQVEFATELNPEQKISNELLRPITEHLKFAKSHFESIDENELSDSTTTRRSFVDFFARQQSDREYDSQSDTPINRFLSKIPISINLFHDKRRRMEHANQVKNRIAHALERNGVEFDYFEAASPNKLILSLAADKVPSASKIAAHHPQVYWVEHMESLYSKDNFDSRSIVQTNKPNRQPFTDAGLTGKNQIVAIADSGLDFLHCFFYDDKHSVPMVNFNSTSNVESKHRKIAAYNSFMDDEEDLHGHGTHIAGTIAGESLYETPLNKYHGIAKDSKIAFFDIGCTKKGGCSCDGEPGCPCTFFPGGKCPAGKNLFLPTDLYHSYFAWAYKAGARIHSNSIGGTIGKGYATSSIEMDRFMYDHPDFLILWSAGNDGKNEGYMTLTGPLKQSKNAIIVGASSSSLESFVDLMNNFRNYTARGEFNKKAIDQQAACKCSHSCYSFACSQAQKMLEPNGCCEVFEDCKLHHPEAGTNPLADIALGCCKKCVLEALKNPDIKEYINTNSLAVFSSLGPTLDGRIKPDIVAPGFYTLSAKSHATARDSVCTPERAQDGTFNIKEMAGTSMSTPTVAATATIVRDYFMNGFYPSGNRNFNDAFVPSAALIKAVLISSARPLTGIARYYETFSSFTEAQRRYFDGFGLVNLANTLYLRNMNTPNRVFATDRLSLETGVSHIFNVRVNNVEEFVPFTVTLVWTDPAGSPSAAISLVNDLDLIVTDADGEIYFGNEVDHIQQPDRLNNVEKVTIEKAYPGVYQVRVTGYHVPKGPQTYALVITGSGIESRQIEASFGQEKRK